MDRAAAKVYIESETKRWKGVIKASSLLAK